MFTILRKLVIAISFNELDILYLLVSDTFTSIPLKYQITAGTGSPVAWQLNVTEFVSFSSSSHTLSVTSA